MRVAPAIVLSDEIRLRLEKLARGRSTSVRIAQRSRIVLLAGKGLENKQIALQMKVAPRMAALWRKRFLAQRGQLQSRLGERLFGVPCVCQFGFTLLDQRLLGGEASWAMRNRSNSSLAAISMDEEPGLASGFRSEATRWQRLRTSLAN